MSEKQVTLRFLAEPSDVNFGGNVFGGNVMKWIDHAGYTCAAGWAQSYCVTAYVGDISFLRPIRVGDLVELRAELMRTGRSSMHISVTVSARHPTQEDSRLTTHCVMVFVAVDKDGEPHPVRTFEPTTKRDRVLADYAAEMITLHQELRDNEAELLKMFGDANAEKS